MSIVHVGFNLTLSESFIEFLQQQFSKQTFSEEVPVAVLHRQSENWRNYRNDNNADEEEMSIWFKKAKSGEAILQALYVYEKSRNPPKNTKFDLIIMARVTIDGKPLYVSLLNNCNISSIDAKKLLCSNASAFQELPCEAQKFTCTPYCKLQN